MEGLGGDWGFCGFFLGWNNETSGLRRAAGILCYVCRFKTADVYVMWTTSTEDM